METVTEPCFGTRFEFEKSEFEICHVTHELIRYAACAGGRQYFMRMEDWRLYLHAHRISVTYEPLRVTPTRIPNSLATPSEAIFRDRWQSYVYGLINTFGWVWPSKQEVSDAATKLAKKISDSKSPGYSTLCRWRKDAARDGLSTDSGMPSFADRGSKSPYSKLEKRWLEREALATIKEDKRISIRNLRNALLGKHLSAKNDRFKSVPFPSERTLCRIVELIDEYELVKARYGKKEADRRFRSAGKSFEADRFLELVFGDGHYLDVLLVPSNEAGEIDIAMLEVEGAYYRPCLTKFIDCASRLNFPGCVTSIPFCTTTALMALKTMVVVDADHPRGVPSRLVLDNGSDYISDGMKRAISLLRFAFEFAEGGYPDAKAIMERYFRELTRFIHSLPGTTFSNPKDKGDYDSGRCAILTLPQLTKAITDFEAILNDEIHGSTRRSPRRYALEGAEAMPPRTILPNEADHIFRVPHLLTIVKGRVKHKEMNWHSPALATYEQKERNHGRTPKVVCLINECDLSNVLVELKDSARTVVKAVNTRPRFSNGLSMWELNLIRERMAEAEKRDIAALGENELILRRHALNLWLREEAKKNRRAVRSVQRQAELRARAAADSASDDLDPTPDLGAIDQMPDVLPPAPDSSNGATDLRSEHSDAKPDPEGVAPIPKEVEKPSDPAIAPASADRAPQATPPPVSRPASVIDAFLNLSDEPIQPFPSRRRQTDILKK